MQHRGLTESTLDVYQGVLVGLLEQLGDDPRGYTAEALRTFVLERARPHGIWRAKSIVVAVRAFLRFLGATGRCSPGMESRRSRVRFLAALIDSAIPRPRRRRAGDRLMRRPRQRVAGQGGDPTARAARAAGDRSRGTGIRRHRLGQRADRRMREGPSAGVAPTAAGGGGRHPAVRPRKQAAVAGAGRCSRRSWLRFVR